MRRLRSRVTESLFHIALITCSCGTGSSRANAGADLHRHRYQAIPDSGWRQARASFDDPSVAFLQNIQNGSSRFKDTNAGSCGLYDGQDGENLTAAIIPAGMRAAIIDSDAAYPGSCGRCYEIRCTTGAVLANASSLEAYPLHDMDGDVYSWASTAPLVDDYNRTFPGNLYNDSDAVFTQCWNASDQPANQDLLNSNGAATIHITGSGTCKGHNAMDGLCTNLTHFVLDYAVFQKLAHPGYGSMNLQFRPVDCNSGTELNYNPGFVDSTMYSDHMEAGWGVNHSAATSSFLQLPGAGINGSNATCFTLEPGKALYFNCRDCDVPGYQPFLLSNTSGISFWTTNTSAATIGKQASVWWPAVTVILGNDDLSVTCNTTVNLVNDPEWKSPNWRVANKNNGMVPKTLLFQNQLRGCIPQLADITSIGFQASGGVEISFCLDQLQLLPSTLHETNETGPGEGLSNCFLPEPEPVDQFGVYLTGEGFPGAQNVSAATPAAEYLPYPFTDMQMYADLHPVLGTCFSNVNQLNDHQKLVDQCASITSYCCYDFTTNPVNTSKSDFLADLCNSMSTNGSICQAFNFQSSKNFGWFKGQAAQQQFDFSQTCRSPYVTSWVLNAAIPPGLLDVRANTAERPGPHSYCDSQLNTNQQGTAAARQLNDAIMVPAVAHDVPGSTSDLSYTVYPHTDMHDYNLKAIGSSCFNVSTPTDNMTDVNTCHSSKDSICCVRYQELTATVDSSLPDTLARICNDIYFQGTSDPSPGISPQTAPLVCQGFVYDSSQQVAFFKGQVANHPIDQKSALCYAPNSTLWLLNAALSPSGKGDTRVQPGSSDKPKKKGLSLNAVYGAVAAILGPAIPFSAWLIVTYSYRQDKLMIIKQVGKHVSEAELGAGAADSAVGSRQGLLVSTSTSSHSSGDPRHSSRGSGDPLITNDPLSSNGPLISNDQLLDAWAMPVAAAPAMQHLARKIAVRSLRRWDAFMGFRAGHDGLGRTLGVWKDKFDGVRFAVLLLALRKLNQQLKMQRGASSSLMQVWQSSNWTQQNALLDQLARIMQNISEQEAQDLPNKDPDVPGMHDKLYGMVATCCRRR